MSGPGSVYVANAFISWLAANSVGWNKLDGKLKFVIMLLIAPVLAILAQIALNYTGYIETQIQPVFQILIVSIVGWLGSQRTYANITRSGYGKLGDGKVIDVVAKNTE
jgi:hypothetical protein